MPQVYSPSQLMTFRQCPRKWWGQSVSKQLKYQPSKQKSRGMILHEQVQDALRDANKFAPIQQDNTVDIDYVAQCVASVHSDRNYGYELYIEHELCMNRAGQKVGWWDDKAFARAKADAFLLHKDVDKPVRIIDIKTGRNYGDSIQLRMEALLAHVIYQRPLVQYEYWYIDQGENEEALIDFRNGLAPVQDIYDTMRDMSVALRNNDFPATANRFCRWCGFYQTPSCGL